MANRGNENLHVFYHEWCGYIHRNVESGAGSSRCTFGVLLQLLGENLYVLLYQRRLKLALCESNQSII